MWGSESIEKKDFGPLEKGKYVCILDNCTIEKIESTGSPYLNFTFTVVGPKSSGRKIWHKLFFTDGAKKMCEQQLENMYVRAAIPACNNAEEYMTSAAECVFKLVGMQFEVAVTGHREYNGKMYPNTFLGKCCDTLLPWQKETVSSTPVKNYAPKSGVDPKEELPF